MTFSPEIVNGLFAIGGAVIGAIIAGLFAIYITKTSKQKKEIVVSTSNPSTLLLVDDQIASNVEVFVSGNKVENVILSEIFLSNTGNRAVEKLEFPVACQAECRIISVNALDQATDGKRLGSTVALNGHSGFSVELDHINPGEEMSLRCIVSGDEPNWTVELRQPELSVVRRDRPVASYSDVLAQIAIESSASIPMLGTYMRITSPVFKRFLDRR